MPNTIIDRSGYARNVDKKTDELNPSYKANRAFQYIEAIKKEYKRPDALYNYGTPIPSVQKIETAYAPFTSTGATYRDVSMLPMAFNKFLPASSPSLIQGEAVITPVLKIESKFEVRATPKNFKNQAY